MSQFPAASSQGAEEIRQAAKDLFAEHGYDAVSISAVAERAGASKANIFHHFASKQGLYFAVMQEATGVITDEFERLLASDQPAKAKVDQAIRAHLAVLFEDEGRARLIFREVLESGPGRAEALARDVFGREFATLSALFAETLGDAEETGIDGSFLAYLLLAANVMLFHCGHVMRHMPGGDFVDQRERYVRMLTETLLRGASAGPEHTG